MDWPIVATALTLDCPIWKTDSIHLFLEK
ncbi:MAG TPA: hypothetical protein DCZ80_03090 [Legionellales bacterium]|nr:hypothetical protein [Legionellales bacterium]